MPKLAIYVPKKEMKEIERWRKKINFSRVFMTALKREIGDQTRRISAPKDKVAAAAEHYRKKLTEGDGPLVDFGYRTGSEALLECRLSSEAVGGLLAIENSDPLSAADVDKVTDVIGKAAKDIERYCEKNGYAAHMHPTWRQAVYRGYVKGVADAWSRVCEEMNA